MAQNIELKAGKLVVFSSGEYSDYGYRGCYVALRNVSEAEMRDAAEAARLKAKESDPEYPNAERFFEPEMISRGWLLAVDLQEIHIGGGYNELDLS